MDAVCPDWFFRTLGKSDRGVSFIAKKAGAQLHAGSEAFTLRVAGFHPVNKELAIAALFACGLASLILEKARVAWAAECLS